MSQSEYPPPPEPGGAGRVSAHTQLIKSGLGDELLQQTNAAGKEWLLSTGIGRERGTGLRILESWGFGAVCVELDLLRQFLLMDSSRRISTSKGVRGDLVTTCGD